MTTKGITGIKSTTGKRFSRGFTLLELIVVFSVISIVSGIGIFSFVTYSRSQTLTTATNDFVTFLYTAKSRAQSQVKPSDATACSGSLDGYEIRLCSGSTTCEGISDVVQDRTYVVYPRCGGATVPSLADVKTFPTNISFDTDRSKTTTTSILFNTISGVVGSGVVGLPGIIGGPGNVQIDGFNGDKKTIKIDSVGNISVQ